MCKFKHSILLNWIFPANDSKSKKNKGAVVRYEKVEIWGILFWQQQYSKKNKKIKTKFSNQKNLKKSQHFVLSTAVSANPLLTEPQLILIARGRRSKN